MQRTINGLSDEDFFHWREVLEKRQENILAAESTIKRQAFTELSAEGTGEISRSRLHPADLATDTQEIETFESLSEKNIRAIQEIESAIERLDNGVFGVCERCDKPIQKARLEIVPEARYCLECEQEIEDMQQPSHS